MILMMSAKMATPGLLEITVFWNEGYDVTISVDDVTNKYFMTWFSLYYMCSFDQSLVTLAFLWQKLSKSQFYKDLTRQTVFLRGGLGSSSIIKDRH